MALCRAFYVAFADTVAGEMATGADSAARSDPTTLTGEMDKLRIFLESEFAQQKHAREAQAGLLAELYEQVCQMRAVHARWPEHGRAASPSFDEERSITSLYSPGSPTSSNLHRSRVGTDGSVATDTELERPDREVHPGEGEDAGFDADHQLAQKRQVRGSYRHSFVRKAQLKHEEKAAEASLRLASLKAYSLRHPPETSTLRAIGRAIIASTAFTGAITVLIFLNVVLLGVEVDMSAKLGQDQVPSWFGTVNAIIVLVFVLEARAAQSQNVTLNSKAQPRLRTSKQAWTWS